MPQTFHLFWLRESGCDAGSPLRAEQLEPEIRDRVLALSGGDAPDITLRLPFLDRREWRRRSEILSALPLERSGNTIACVLKPQSAARDLAARLALTDPAWTESPLETDLQYFPVWQSVSMALQLALRTWIPEQHFHDVSCYEDRKAAFPMLVYQVARLYRGRPRTEFTYDLRDYPDCEHTLGIAWKMIGRSLQTRMSGIEQRLHEAGMPALARRYAPVWYEDVLVAVRDNPKTFVNLLAAESMLINAVIDLGSDRNVAGVNRFARTAGQALRHVHGSDMRLLGVRVLEETTRALNVGRACP